MYLLFSVPLQKGEGAGSQELGDNPFVGLLGRVAVSSSFSLSDRAFVADLVAGRVAVGSSVSTFADRVVVSVDDAALQRLAASCESQRRNNNTNNNDNENENETGNENAFSALVGAWRSAAVGRIVCEGSTTLSEETTDEDLLALVGGATLFEPRWTRPTPPKCELEPGELVWIDVEPMHFDVSWDPSMGIELVSVDDMRKLLDTACSEPLPPELHAELLERLEDSLPALEQAGLSPARLVDLVEQNPGFAIELLFKLMSSAEISDYLTVLVNMELTPHSMEVVSGLLTSVEMPSDFIHLYITNCIAACKNVTDKFNQTRLVRLVSIFLQSLIRNQTIDVLDLQTEVQGFCLEFSKLKEAAALFKMLKTGE